jgi:hypothetical protein
VASEVIRNSVKRFGSVSALLRSVIWKGCVVTSPGHHQHVNPSATIPQHHHSMPFVATVHRVMIASPGDVQRERDIVRAVLDEWNSVNGARRKLMLLPLGWETDVAPEMGDEPQKIINKRLLKDADLLVGIFWTRLGTPTSGYASGAVEEIEEHLAAGKPAMLYFSSAPAQLDAVDPQQYAALKAFKDSCKSRGVFEIYTDVGDFRQKFAKHLQIVLNEDGFAASETGDAPRTSTPAAPPTLSKEAVMLLKAATADAGGTIMFERHGGGSEIQSNDQVFNADSSPRTIALWEGAIEELESRGLVKATSERREVFEVTRQGFAAVDGLKA